MIRSGRWRVTAPKRPSHSTFRSAVAVRLREAETNTDEEPYGNLYGAGPSRMPYTPPTIPANDYLTRNTTRDSARRIRNALSNFPPGTFTTPKSILSKLFPGSPNVLFQLSQLELHAILHYLIRMRRSLPAAGILVEFLDKLSPAGRRVIAARTLAALANPKGYSLTQIRFSTSVSPSSPVPQPTIDQQRPHAVSRVLRILLALVDHLQRARHPRPEALYTLVINQCVSERRHDEAAKVYVGLVEEWILEGRVAEGADPADFYRGGGPPRQAPRTSPLHRLWFSGVRTWRLPGEVLSPHDRLDLWHPHHLAASDRLRGFPFPLPTSPPSLVPPPSLSLLTPILKSLSLDPAMISPAEFAITMRALATLANTVLSRTLPIPAIPILLRTFAASRMFPEVYPESIQGVPKRNSWAYTANTQVHVALVSLLWSPPNYARVRELEHKYSLNRTSQESGPSVGPDLYMLPALSWQSCLVLVEYAVSKLKQPRLITRLLRYMRVTYRETLPKALTMLFRGSTLARDNQMAQTAEDALFANTILGKERIPDGDRETAASPSDQQVVSFENTPVADPEPPLSPNEYSLSSLISHLAATSQLDRLAELVYILIPYLSVSRNSSAKRLDAAARAVGAAVGFRGRPVPTPLSPHLYSVIIAALSKSGSTGLAQRVFHLSQVAESAWAKQHENDTIPQSLRLPIHIFTSMILVYSNEAHARGDSFPIGWITPDHLSRLPRSAAGEAMVQHVYNLARRRWIPLIDACESTGPITPDARFFNTVIYAKRKRWCLDDQSYLNQTPQLELERFVHDMVEFGYMPPPGLLSKMERGVVVGDRYLPTVDYRGRANTSRPTARGAYIPQRRDMERNGAASGVDELSPSMPSNHIS